MPMAAVVMSIALGLGSVGQIGPVTHVGTLTEGLESPARVAVTADEILATDPQANAVVRFDLAGTYLGTWSEPAGPLGVAVHPDGRIFVSRRDDGKVGVYDSSFTLLRFLGDGDPMVNFVKPTDLVLDSSTGRIYVVDSGGDRIYGFESDESLALMLGVRGSLPSQFKYPSAIAVDPANGLLVVADQDNYRVQVFSTAGVFQFKFGYRIKYLPGGGTEGWLPRTAGLAVDAESNIYVTDGVMGALRVFGPTGLELAKLVDYGTAPGELQTPGGVALDAAGRLFIANSTGGGVEIYETSRDAAGRPVGKRYAGTNASRMSVARAVMRIPGPLGPETGGGHGEPDSGDGLLMFSRGWDPPHMLDDVNCNRCHDVDGQPGGHLGTVDGQTVLCISCHTGAGQACASLVLPAENLGMSHAWGVSAVSETYGSDGPTPGGPMDLHLAEGNIKCATCHEQHNSEAGEPFLRVSPQTICRDCHSGHVVHTPDGDWQPTCLECHAAHDADDRNLSLVRSPVHNQTLGTDKPVVLTARTGPNSFADGDPANIDGICEVCHTDTNYHKHDGSGLPHNGGQDCIMCHPHEAGFMPAGGGCTGCHASPQDTAGIGPPGGRRAVVGEFPVDDAHAHYGSELTDGACTICHDQATHIDGNVDLIDPDTGSLYTFERPGDLASDPDVSDFCASCHDADGAARLGAAALDPFGNGNVPPDVATRFQGTLQWDEWYGDFCFGEEGTLRQVNSHHDISDADQAWSGAKLECLNCHGAHSSSAAQRMVDPYDPPSPWTGVDNDFCLACHAGGFGPTDPALPTSTLVGDVYGPTVAMRGLDTCDYYSEPWWVQYSWTHAAHGLDSKRGWGGYSGAPGAEVACLACHDAHGSYTPTNPAGNPYAIRDYIDAETADDYVDDGMRTSAWTGPPWDTTGTPGDVVVAISGIEVSWGELCVRCHADWLSGYWVHSSCTGCQTCHGHGQTWQNYDWGANPPADDTPCPSNNSCDYPIDISTLGVPYAGDTSAADDDDVQACGGSVPTETVWYSVAGTGNTLTATTCNAGTGFDTNVQVFCDTCDALVCVAASDDDAGCAEAGTASTVSWCSDLNQTYLIQLGGSNGAHGTYELVVTDDGTPCGPPDGCPAGPAPLVEGPEPSMVEPIEGKPATAPHPDNGLPVPLHGALNVPYRAR